MDFKLKNDSFEQNQKMNTEKNSASEKLPVDLQFIKTEKIDEDEEEEQCFVVSGIIGPTNDSPVSIKEENIEIDNSSLTRSTSDEHIRTDTKENTFSSVVSNRKNKNNIFFGDLS